jgi:phage gpG-like protein
MTLELGLVDSCSAALAAMPERIRDALSAKSNTLAAALQEKIRQKLAGEALQTRSGALAASIVASIAETPQGIAVRIASTDVKYAAIHEFGGTIPPHQIVPDKAKALAFIIGGKQVFAARVQIPAVTMPVRSYMRSSLAEMAAAIREGLSEAVGEALNSA